MRYIQFNFYSIVIQLYDLNIMNQNYVLYIILNYYICRWWCILYMGKKYLGLKLKLNFKDKRIWTLSEIYTAFEILKHNQSHI